MSDKRRPEWQCLTCGSTAKPEPTGERWRGEFSEEIYRCTSCGHRNLLHDFRSDEFYPVDSAWFKRIPPMSGGNRDVQSK